MKINLALSFDDVLLVPQKSKILSRSEVDISTSISERKFSLPIISSPMDTVTEESMCLEMLNHGGLGIIHRYNTIKEQSLMVTNIRDVLESVSHSAIVNIAAALPASGDLLERAQALYSAGCRIFCIDVAHGHHVLAERALKAVRDTYGSSVVVIAGNVATSEGYRDMSSWGADAVRIGIGGGSICSTRIQTGHGVPTFQSVLDCRDTPGAAIIADGGIRSSGDIVKALAAGADMVMLGSMLAGTEQSPGEVFVSKEGRTSKIYRGMASVEAQVAWRGKASSLEGISTTIPYKGSVKKILNDIEQNLKSGLSYSGVDSISRLQSKAKFIRQTSAGASESGTHILTP